MISELDIYRAANLVIKHHGSDAIIEAARTTRKVLGTQRPSASVPQKMRSTLEAGIFLGLMPLAVQRLVGWLERSTGLSSERLRLSSAA